MGKITIINNINNINKTLINLSTNSTFFKKYIHKQNQLTKIINSYLKNSNSRIGIGLYGEKRKA